MRFILTQELGRLAKWLRLLGFDAAYFPENNSSSLIIQALRDERVIITRNSHLPKSRGLKIALLEAEKIKEQIIEISRKLDLRPDKAQMFTRCLLCNAALEAIDKQKVKDKVPGYVYQTQENFITCPQCKRIYWKGTHWGNVEKILAEIM